MRRRGAVAGVVLAGILAGGTAWSAPVCPPAVPPTVTAIPRYGAPPSVLVQWTDTPAETSYEVWRGDNGGALAKIATLGANVLNYRDMAVDTTTDYHYQVRTCIAAVCPVHGDFNTSVKVLWPVPARHEVLHGFNEVLAFAGVRGGAMFGAAGFHDGVDLNGASLGAAQGDMLMAPRGGVVDQTIDSMTADDSFLAMRVEVGTDGMGNAIIEYDGFNHTANNPADDRVVCMGQVVAPGQQIGRVGIRQFSAATGDFTDHTHSEVTTGSPFMVSARHFLTIFTAAADRDPQGNPPALFDENGDGKNVLFRDHNQADKTKYLDYDHDTKPLSGDLDIHVEIMDQQGTNPRQAPIDLGYWIEGPRPDSDDKDDVASAATAYKLYDFRSVYFGNPPPTNCALVSDIGDAANSGCKGITDCLTAPAGACVSVIKENGINFPWPILHHFIVTHAKGTDGSRANVDVNQYWRTKAKEDEVAVPNPANYSGQPLATKPTEARFPDGDYKLHVLASDLVHSNVDVTIDNIRLENYPPYILSLDVYGDLDDNVGTQVDADHPGCEVEIYKFDAGLPPKPYPGGGYLAASQRNVFARADRRLCLKIRFSEQMDKNFPGFKVEIDPQGAAGASPIIVAGAFSKTWVTDDTWKGQIFLAADPSGNSDSSQTDPSKDAIVRVVARDLPDRNMVQRGLDEAGNGTGKADNTDENHRIKLDLRVPDATIDVKKTL